MVMEGGRGDNGQHLNYVFLFSFGFLVDALIECSAEHMPLPPLSRGVTNKEIKLQKSSVKRGGPGKEIYVLNLGEIIEGHNISHIPRGPE